MNTNGHSLAPGRPRTSSAGNAFTIMPTVAASSPGAEPEGISFRGRSAPGRVLLALASARWAPGERCAGSPRGLDCGCSRGCSSPAAAAWKVLARRAPAGLQDPGPARISAGRWAMLSPGRFPGCSLAAAVPMREAVEMQPRVPRRSPVRALFGRLKPGQAEPGSAPPPDEDGAGGITSCSPACGGDFHGHHLLRHRRRLYPQAAQGREGIPGLRADLARIASPW